MDRRKRPYQHYCKEIFMKVLLINGSPHPKGCTYTALSTVAKQLEKHGLSTQMLHIGHKAVRGCIACGKCVRECPRELIRIHECANPVVVKCSNRDPGKDARKMCEVSCIGCGICQKLCPAGAITVQDNLSHIDESLCLSCGQCAVKCPRHAIYDLRGILTEKR